MRPHALGAVAKPSPAFAFGVHPWSQQEQQGPGQSPSAHDGVMVSPVKNSAFVGAQDVAPAL